MSVCYGPTDLTLLFGLLLGKVHLVGLGHLVVQTGGAVCPGGLLVLELREDHTQAAGVKLHKVHIQTGEITYISTYRSHVQEHVQI